MPFETTLTPGKERELRTLVETTALPFREIGARLGISASTVSRQMRHRGWVRPAGAPLTGTARFAARQEENQAIVANSLWSVMARGAQHLEAQETPPTTEQMRPLIALGTTLARVSRAQPVSRDEPAPATIAPDEEPVRSVEDLRQELGRHLDRLLAEEEWERSFGFDDPNAPAESPGSVMAEYYYRFEDGAGI